MLALDRQTTAASRSGNQPPIQLRFRADGRLVEIPVGKTTVGSSPRCNLRIEQPGVQPVHCLIVNGLDGLTVRRWAPNTLLNGAAFDEAPFADGDCLAVAEVELELVSPQAEVEEPAEWPTTPTIASNELLDTDLLDTDLLDTVQQSVDEMAKLEVASSEAEAPEVCEVVSTPELELAADAAEPSVENEPAIEDEPDTVVDEAPAAADELSALAAAEIVFQDLKTACANSRGRSRKLLAALRSKQENYSELAERLTEVEAQLAELRKLRNEWDETHLGHDAERHQWESQLRELRQQLDECEARLADYAQQMVELREELATIRSHEATIAEVTGIDSEEDESSSSSQVVDWLPVSKATQPIPEDAVTDTYPAASELDEQRPDPADFYDSESAREPEPTRNWESQLMSEAWRLADVGPSESASEPQVTDELADVEYASEERPAWQANSADAELTPSVETASEEDNPFSQFSIWKQGIFRDSPNHEEPVAEEPVSEPSSAPIWTSEFLRQEAAEPAEETTIEAAQVETPAAEQRPSWASALEQPTVEQAEPAPPQPEQASYLERYSHLFAEEKAAAAEPEAPVPPPVVIHTPPPSLNVSHEMPEAKSAGGDDEESIEQYMAKLLQRVRRDSPAGASSQAPPVIAAEVAPDEAAAEAAARQQTIAATVEASQPKSSEPMSEADADREIATWRGGDRRPVTSASDLGALRAIANQTARRAISRHQLARHKRDATTKVIVATLAGVTSLWLMIRAASWLDIQFIAACGSLLVAACWAGKAFREMLRSWKAAAQHGTGNLLADSGEHQHAGLPIDVEDRF